MDVPFANLRTESSYRLTSHCEDRECGRSGMKYPVDQERRPTVCVPPCHPDPDVSSGLRTPWAPRFMTCV